MRFLSPFLLLFCALTFCAGSYAQSTLLTLDGPLTTRNVAGPNWAAGQSVYEVNLDSYGFPRGQALRGFSEHLPVLKEMGAGLIKLMPIYPRGEKNAQGSAWAVRDFREINPNYGTRADFAHFMQRAHELGLYIILDWTPGSTSWDHAFIEAHPEYYRKNAKGEVRGFAARPDVARLDYGETGSWNMPLWQQMRDDLRFWIDEFDVDGFHAENAADAPVEFYTWLRPQLNAGRSVLLTAGAGGPELHPAFDATQSLDLPPLLWQIVAGAKPATAIDKLLRDEVREFPAGAVRLRFLDKHDWHNDANQPGALPKYEGTDTSILQRYKGGIEPLMVLCATLPGRLMVYNGQEMSNAKAAPPTKAEARRTSPQWSFYQRLLALVQNSEAIGQGSFTRIATDRDEKVYAYTRQRGPERVLVVLNLSEAPQTVTLKGAAPGGAWRDVFSGADTTLETEPAFNLEAWGYRVLASSGA